jgi:hypothetical protein
VEGFFFFLLNSFLEMLVIALNGLLRVCMVQTMTMIGNYFVTNWWSL